MDYVHGYSAREGARLADQAATLTELLHAGTHYFPGSRVLEAGCGTGAQTVILAGHSPQADFTCIDVSRRSLAVAARQVRRSGCANVTFPARRHLQPAVPAVILRSRLRVLRAGACQRPGRSARGAADGPEARRLDHGDRGRSRLGVLPSRQR